MIWVQSLFEQDTVGSSRFHYFNESAEKFEQVQNISQKQIRVASSKGNCNGWRLLW